MTRQSKEWLQQTLDKGLAALRANRIEEAGECCRQVLTAKPDLVPGHFLVGLVALEAKDRKTAFSAFGSVTKLQPQHVAAWAHLAKLFILEGKMAKADSALANAVAQKVREPLVADLIASVYAKLEDHDEATVFHKMALDLLPNHLPYLVNYANSLVYHGRTEEAQAFLNKAIAMDPFNPQAHWILSSTIKAKDDNHIQQMHRALGKHTNAPRNLAFLYYAIGKEQEDLENWTAAFDAFSQGAAARYTTIEYDELSEVGFFKALEENLTQEWSSSKGRGYDTEAPIFILGQPRTGTTLVERIVTSHSMVHSAGELQQFGFAIRRLSQYAEPRRFSAELLKHALKIDPYKLGKHYFESTRKVHGNTSRFVDKLPTNFAYLPLIAKALPNAKIVHLRRAPMDACFASFKQLFADAYLHSYEQKEMARHHARYLKLMQLWRERFPGSFFDISYEQTTRNLEPNARALIDYLGLPWEDACLHFHEQKAAVTTASAAQVRQPVHTRSIDRWKKYETQLQPMRHTLEEQGVGLNDY